MKHSKLSIAFIFFTLVGTSSADVPARDTALEANSIRVEFNSISNSGRVHVYHCEQCKQSDYSFTKKPHIMRKGKTITFEIFMLDYWNAKYPTLILDSESLTVLEVVY